MINYLATLQNLTSFVIISFVITFVACAIIYYNKKKLKIRKEFMKELQQLTEIERREVLNNSKLLEKFFFVQTNNLKHFKCLQKNQKKE